MSSVVNLGGMQAKEVVSNVVDVVPITGTVKSVVEVVTGKDYITGELSIAQSQQVLALHLSSGGSC